MNTDEIRRKIGLKGRPEVVILLHNALDEIDRLRKRNGNLRKTKDEVVTINKDIEQRTKEACKKSIEELIGQIPEDYKIVLPDGFLYLRDFKQAIEEA